MSQQHQQHHQQQQQQRYQQQYYYQESTQPPHNFAKRPRPSPSEIAETYYDPDYDQYAGDSTYSDAPNGTIYVLPSTVAGVGGRAPAYPGPNRNEGPYDHEYAMYGGHTVDPNDLRREPPLPGIPAGEAAGWTRTVPSASDSSSSGRSASIFLPHTPQTHSPPGPEMPAPAPRAAAGGKKKAATSAAAAASASAGGNRKRRPASCTPCRQKKLRCNRAMPCESCVEREVECVWDG